MLPPWVAGQYLPDRLFIPFMRGQALRVEELTGDSACETEIENTTEGRDVAPFVAPVPFRGVRFWQAQELVSKVLATLRDAALSLLIEGQAVVNDYIVCLL